MDTAAERVLLNGEISWQGSKTHLQLRATKTAPQAPNAPPRYTDWEVAGDKLFGLTDGEYLVHVENGQTVAVRVLDGQFLIP